MQNPIRTYWLFAAVALVGIVASSFAGFRLASPVSAATITVNTQVDAFLDGSDGKCGLREAIINADADAQIHTDCPPGDGEDTIVFQSGVAMITLVAGLPVISSADALTIDGKDTVTISGDNTYYIFGTNGTADLTLQDLTLTNGGEGAIFNNGKLELNSSNVVNSNNNSDGGGFANFDSGEATISDSTFSGNSALAGSGGSIFNAGKLTVHGTDVNGDASMNGGGLYSEGELHVDDNTSIAGRAVDGGAVYIAFGTATITDSNVKNAMASDLGGGIYNKGTLTLDNTTVSANRARGGAGIENESMLLVQNGSHIDGNSGGDFSGGGISNSGTTTITDSTVDDNTTENYGGGIITFTPNLDFTKGVTVTNGSVSGNTASKGGGAFELARGFITIDHSVVNDNTATTEDGGGIHNFDGGQIISITDSTFSGNSAAGMGGAIQSSVGDTVITVVRSTFNDNSAAFGGAIRSDFSTVNMSNSTISHNTAMYGGGIYNGQDNTTNLTNVTVTANIVSMANSGGGIYSPDDVSDTINLRNTIVADQNAGSDCDGLGFHSLGNNLDSDDNCRLNASGDKPQSNVFLGTLADNGGLTKTHALLSNSEALDGGDDATCAAPPINGKDQRGVTRPQGDHCDIGAFELEVATPTPTVSPTPTHSPTPAPSTSPVRQTELWGDNDCSGAIDFADVDRGLRAAALPDTLQPIDGCPEMGEAIEFIDIHPAGSGTLFWGDVHCGAGINGFDALDVLRHIGGFDPLSVVGFCPKPGDEVVFETQ